MANTPVPPAPATTSPAGTRTGVQLGSLGSPAHSGSATGGAGAPSGNLNPTTPMSSGGTQGASTTTGGGTNANPPNTNTPSGNQPQGGTQPGGQSTMQTWKKILCWVVGAILILGLLGLLFGGCGAGGMWVWKRLNPPPAPTPPPPVTIVIPPPPAPPVDPDVLQPSDVKTFCKETSRALQWALVWPDTGTEGSMVVKVCHNPTWTAKRDRRVTSDGRFLRVAEGEGSAVINLAGGPLGDGWETMREKFKKNVLIGQFKGEPIELSGNALLVLIPPATQNPVSVFTEECDEMRKLSKAPEDRWLKEIWARCQLGGPRNVAVATSMRRACSVSGCFSRDDGATLAARVRAVESEVRANGDKPVQPTLAGYDTSQPR